ncbi:MAG: hypothetical protein JSW40_07085 [Candidatus Omnitrophota bacterium]|nr:MAG: hypothetical protein JSW40_07085 [Candidatus Omnitrophota bacterium]
METKTFAVLLLLIVLYMSQCAFAETIVLKSGKTVEAKIIEQTDRFLKIDFHGVAITYYLDEVESIDGKKLSFQKEPKEKLGPGDKLFIDLDKEVRIDQRPTFAMEELSPEGIYTVADVTMRFIPPSGWKRRVQDSSSSAREIQFSPENFEEIASLHIGVSSASAFLILDASMFLENIMREVSKDPNVIEKEVISLAGTKALSVVTSYSGIKTKQIQFVKDAHMFTFAFVAQEKNFDRWLPSVSQSLETFDIVSSLSPGVPRYTDSSLSASKELYQKFQSICDAICLELVEKSDGTLSEREDSDVDLQARIAASKVSYELMARFANAFAISDAEASDILSGGYNEAKNRSDIEKCLRELSKLTVVIIEPVENLIAKYNEQKLRGLQLEFAARVLKEYVRQAKSAQ